MSLAKSAILAALGICLAGCSLPSAGPTVSQVERSADPALDVYLVKVTPRVVGVLNSFREEGFPKSFRLEGHRPSIALQPGDVIGINIYEAGGTPLFGGVSAASPGGGGQGQPTVQPATSVQATTLPAQLIESNGQILVPYVGRVKVTGMTPAQASEEITRKLAEQTVRPQVIVSLVGNNANAVSVGGEVNKAGVVFLSLRGERLLDVISQAGGPKYTAMETDVRLIRGTSVVSIPLQLVLTNPENNVAVRPNDTIQLVHNPKTFVVLGAVTKVAQYTMDTERVTVAEGIGRAGGTVDTYGNLAGIFLLRSEPTSFARAVIGADQDAVDRSYVQTEETRQLAGRQTRMIYRIDLTQAGGYFFAQNMVLRDKDIILVANSEATQVQKAMTLLRAFTGAYFDLSRGAAFYVPSP